jgi:hypothetical protein
MDGGLEVMFENPKLEYRNPEQIRISNTEILNPNEVRTRILTSQVLRQKSSSVLSIPG